MYGSPTDDINGVDGINFREGSLDRRTLHFDGHEDDSVFSSERAKCYNTGDIPLARNNDRAWRFIEHENVFSDSVPLTPNRAGIGFDWDPERDQYVIIRCSVYIDTYDHSWPPLTGGDAWDLGLFIIPPHEDILSPLPEYTNAYHTSGEHPPVVWPYQRVCLSDVYARDMIFFESLSTGNRGEDFGNDVNSGIFVKHSRFNASFQLNYAARSGKSKTQAGVTHPQEASIYLQHGRLRVSAGPI